MTAFLPTAPGRNLPEPEHPRLHQRPPREELRARWEVRAAQWRARALAESIFGRVSEMRMTGIRAGGPLRGLLRLDVPFADVEEHRDREARFLAAVETDPVLSHVRLVYVIGPEAF